MTAAIIRQQIAAGTTYRRPPGLLRKAVDGGCHAIVHPLPSETRDLRYGVATIDDTHERTILRSQIIGWKAAGLRDSKAQTHVTRPAVTCASD